MLCDGQPIDFALDVNLSRADGFRTDPSRGSPFRSLQAQVAAVMRLGIQSPPEAQPSPDTFSRAANVPNQDSRTSPAEGSH